MHFIFFNNLNLSFLYKIQLFQLSGMAHLGNGEGQVDLSMNIVDLYFSLVITYSGNQLHFA